MLKQLASLVSQHIREADIFGRFGGEEFMIIMPNTPLQQARLAAESLRKRIAEHDFIVQNVSLTITVSIGVSEWLGEAESYQEIINRADQALYLAKNNGRNRVET